MRANRRAQGAGAGHPGPGGAPRAGTGTGPPGSPAGPSARAIAAPRVGHAPATRAARPTGSPPGYSLSACRKPVFTAVSPPSTHSVVPVTHAASDEARKATAAAMSSGSPTRPSG